MCVAGVAAAGVRRHRRQQGRLFQRRVVLQPRRRSSLLKRRRGKKRSSRKVYHLSNWERFSYLKGIYYLQANEAQALLEVPGRSGLAGRTADAVARGLGRAQTSSRQPLPGLRPLGLRMEVGFPSFLLIRAWLGHFCFGSANFIRFVFLLMLVPHSFSSYIWIQFYIEPRVKYSIIFVGSGT